MRRRLVAVSVAVSMAGCGGAATPATNNTTASAMSTATAHATAAITAVPNATPTAKPRLGPGQWVAVEGSQFVTPNPVAAVTDRGGVLLLTASIPSTGDPCEPPERNARGTPASFYDPQTKAIVAVASGKPTWGYGLTTLRDGRVMLAGGEASEGRATRIWDPHDRAWSDGPPLNVGRLNPFVVTMADGRVMAGMDNPTLEMLDPAFSEDPSLDFWSLIPAPALTIPDDGPDQVVSVVALTSGPVLALGGNGTAALYDDRVGAWRDQVGVPSGPAIALPDGSALIFDFGGGVVRYDPRTGSQLRWPVPSDLPAPSPTSPSVAVLKDGRVFFAGGAADGGFLDTARVFDPDTGATADLARMPNRRGGAVAVALEDGSVLVVGGADVVETQPATDDMEGNDTPGCVPVTYRALRWLP